MPKNVFLSFVVEDKTLVDLFRGQARNRRVDLNFRDYSVKEPFENAWKTNVEALLRACSVTICLVGHATYASDAVNWEIDKSRELGNAVFGVYLQSRLVSVPTSLTKAGAPVIGWDIDKIMQAIGP